MHTHKVVPMRDTKRKIHFFPDINTNSKRKIRRKKQCYWLTIHRVTITITKTKSNQTSRNTFLCSREKLLKNNNNCSTRIEQTPSAAAIRHMVIDEKKTRKEIKYSPTSKRERQKQMQKVRQKRNIWNNCKLLLFTFYLSQFATLTVDLPPGTQSLCIWALCKSCCNLVQLIKCTTVVSTTIDWSNDGVVRFSRVWNRLAETGRTL